jgi:hypothetical protein
MAIADDRLLRLLIHADAQGIGYAGVRVLIGRGTVLTS